MTFEDLGLSPALLSAIADAGYEKPTPIQAGAIPVALTGRDVLGIAQTGTGKTASFTLPMIERLSRGRARARMPRSLVLAPTRELAAQVADNVKLYAKNHKLNMALLIGGVSFEPQKRILDQGADILIATPGRLLDHFERGGLLLTGVEILVIDEADRMLDMGFIPDIERILKLLPPRRQTLFFSATMPAEIKKLVDTFLRDPERVEVTRPAQTAETITQYILRVSDNQARTKREALRAAINRDGVKNGIIFCNRKRDVDIVARSLQRHGFSAAPIHGDLDQSQRMKTLADFKSGDLRLLVASDVAARGLDIPAVSHVFNVDIPRNADDYVHRIGRTGRAGLKGEAVTLVSAEDAKALAKVVKLIGKEPEELKLDGAAKQASGTPSANPVSSEAASDDKPKPRRRTRSRNKADASKAKADASETSDAAASEDAPAMAEAPIEARAHEESQPKEHPAPRERSSRSQRASRQDRSSRQDRHERDASPVGFGDHVPEFLLRPAFP
ncbi:DEAD/DEAH box helicase [Oceanicaulis sp.]|uniref:DEAD/DEAH box helicase n=1 Tax=Oceanicaulis sp. TaxID=1924941 RepID=UPI003BAC95CF